MLFNAVNLRRLSAARALTLACAVATMTACSGKISGWIEVTASDAEVSAQRQRAEASRDELASTLLTELQTALSTGGVAKGIEVCKQRAPEIASAVGQKHRVSIGRSSSRLRNPSNVGPGWAAPSLVEATPRFFREQKDGRLGALFPIVLGPQCVVCHGKQDALSSEVKAALAEHYPTDRATGFAPGDLRGWFWVEVPRGE